ncbi:MAG: hypothetical protein COT74_04100 [Bdellovibrionales bacterium CG10_big_fil_rev_8_21_14_0_10_45_34]|nr:MAG: hypothetical protein COT74_04100 [Bdellovibrionales bacterium CG10_big_fil_rev_8_21_14_0_10_45_34]
MKRAVFVGSEAGFDFDLKINWAETAESVAEGQIQFKLASKNTGLKALLKAQVDYGYKSKCNKNGEEFEVSEVTESWRISMRGKTLFEKTQTGDEFKSKVRSKCFDLVQSFFLADAGKADEIAEFDIAFPNRCYHVTTEFKGDEFKAETTSEFTAPASKEVKSNTEGLSNRHLVARSGPLAAEFLGSPIEKMTARYGGKKLPIPLPLDCVTLTRVP